MKRHLATMVMVTAFLVVGCSAFAQRQPPPKPRPCADIYPSARCDLIVDNVVEQLGVDRDEIVRIDLVPGPTPEIRSDGTTILQTLGGAPVLRVAATLADGTSRTVAMCGGVAMEPACVDEPQLRASSTFDGYRDVPEGSTPLPTVAPAADATSEPLRMAHVDIRIDHAGAFEVRLGSGSLANGVLTEASFTLPDAWPADVVIPSGRVFLDIRSLELDGRPFDNYYTHGWRAGVERFEATLVFDVSRFNPGAVLTIEDVVVR